MNDDDTIQKAGDISHIYFDYEDKDKIPIIKEEIKQEIKPEPLDEEVEGVHEKLNNDIIKRAEDVSNILFDYEDEDKIPIKEKVKEEKKPNLWMRTI